MVIKKIGIAILIIAVFAFVAILFKQEYKSNLNSQSSEYSGLVNIDLIFDLTRNSYAIGDVFGTIESCEDPMFEKCVKFNKTIIMLPSEEFLTQNVEEYYEGESSTLGIAYSITSAELEFFGSAVKGYIFEVGRNDFPIGYDLNNEGQKGVYFYSFTNGVVFFSHFSEVKIDGKNPTLLRNLMWSKTRCGLFCSL
ncbi:MAG: hypothetical protein OQK04_00830 [Kangiellaceae bacterium]|nr:hypothetical protein [Kangiellaceae bacterium]